MITLDERHGGGSIGGLADHPDVRRAGEREPQSLAHDLVVVGDQAGDLVHQSDSTTAGPVWA